MRHFSGVFDISSLKNLGIFEKLKNVKEKLLNYVYIYRTVMNIVLYESLISSFHLIHLIHLIDKSHFSAVRALW